MTSPISFTTQSGHHVEIRPCTMGDVDSFLAFQAAIATETTHTLKMEDHARTKNISRVKVMVRTQNNRGIRLYTRMG